MFPVGVPLLAAGGTTRCSRQAAPCSLTRDVRIIVDVGLSDGMLNAFIGREYECKKNTQGPGIQSKKPKGDK